MAVVCTEIIVNSAIFLKNVFRIYAACKDDSITFKKTSWTNSNLNKMYNCWFIKTEDIRKIAEFSIISTYFILKMHLESLLRNI